MILPAFPLRLLISDANVQFIAPISDLPNDRYNPISDFSGFQLQVSGARGKMEAQPSGHQLLEAELTEKLEVMVLPEMSEVHEHCIYIVREGARQVNPKAYTPQVVSIGPFHNPRGSGEEKNKLKPMEELKLKYLKGFLKRTKLRVADILLKLYEWEDRIRSCYAIPISYDSDVFLEIIITDACFIIELFLRHCKLSEWKEKDPLFSKPSLVGDIAQDLLLLKNQLPFFVLDDIYNLADGLNLGFHAFVHITLFYFKCHFSYSINREKVCPNREVCPKHFTDLLRTIFLPSSSDHGQRKIEDAIEKVYYSASQLKEAGLEFKDSKSTSVFDLKFEKGVLTMPCFHVDDNTETHLRNILAFEEYHLPFSAYVTQYLWILDDLINTEKDVSILVDKKIIFNSLGDANSVVAIVNNLCKNIWQPPKFNSEYLAVCKSLNGFYENPWNKYKAIIIHEYFNTPVKIASTIAAMLLLLLTLIQTIFSVWSFFKEKKKSA